MNTEKRAAHRIEFLMHAVLLCGVAALNCTTAQAAVSGYYDSAEQIQTIVQDARLADALKQMPIERFEIQPAQANDATRHWRIRSRDCELTVELEAQRPAGPGKTTYLVKKIGACR